jgi:predicted Zn-dependent peptidase
MTTKFKGAVFILNEGDDASVLAEYISENYFKSSEYHYQLQDAIPANLPDDIARWTKQSLDKHPGARVLLFHPSKDTSIVPEKKRNGQIPR